MDLNPKRFDKDRSKMKSFDCGFHENFESCVLFHMWFFSDHVQLIIAVERFDGKVTNKAKTEPWAAVAPPPQSVATTATTPLPPAVVVLPPNTTNSMQRPPSSLLKMALDLRSVDRKGKFAAECGKKKCASSSRY
ncbi:hypothetical protein C1H46_000589 [Malus baccata]|uniref:Uncharacterized protein n=1 Tax=Malus baccata TaxID=106549 RepID=A0A540NRE0_MALBA|nr:hypothetical protein C1H46_000589 [Malus baccata]